MNKIRYYESDLDEIVKSFETDEQKVRYKMQIVIDISENIYNLIARGEENRDFVYKSDLMRAILEGTPLPKGHGKIVDIGKIDKDRIESDNPVLLVTVNGEYIEAVSLDYLNNLPSIVEADKEE